MSSINHSERGHAILSPSSSERWLNCTPSARLAEAAGSKTSEYAEEGTTAHELAEYVLKSWIDGTFYPECDEMPVPDDIAKNKYFSEEMRDAVGEYVNFVVEEFYEMGKGPLGGSVATYLEEKLDISKFAPESFGSSDVTLISPSILHIIDLKYGKGVRVPAESPQFKMYALGALAKFNNGSIKYVRMSVGQPRLHHYDTIEMSVPDLLDWDTKILQPKAKLAFEGKGKQVVGSWCQFCPVKATCRAQKDEIAHDFEEHPDTLVMTDEEIVDMLGKLDRYKSWLESLNQYAYSEAMKGKKWEGYKLVEGRTARKIVDPDKVRNVLLKEYLEDEVLNINLKGITDLEKLVGKKVFNAKLGEYVKSQPGAPKLVPDSHNGKEYDVSSDFDVES
nr:MAG TPA: PD-(D/E)XK nuclease superfamily protein [Caudoviricetes sp.]